MDKITLRAQAVVDDLTAGDVVRVLWAVAVMVCVSGISRRASAGLLGAVKERAETLLSTGQGVRGEG
jgi:hypothetical protein